MSGPLSATSTHLACCAVFFQGFFRTSLSCAGPTWYVPKWFEQMLICNLLFSQSPAHDIAENYSNLIKSVFLGLYVLSLVPSSPLLTALACLTSYWVPTATLFVFRSAQNVTTFMPPSRWIKTGYAGRGPPCRCRSPPSTLPVPHKIYLELR